MSRRARTKAASPREQRSIFVELGCEGLGGEDANGDNVRRELLIHGEETQCGRASVTITIRCNKRNKLHFAWHVSLDAG